MIVPDGTLGAVLGSESLGIAETLVNGAGGCRSRTQILLRDLIPEYAPEPEGCCRSGFYSRQSRLPCTFLNGNDIIFGTAPKVVEGSRAAGEVSGRRALVVDTLGASLICTDRGSVTSGTREDPVLMDGDLSSMSFQQGYDLAVRTVLESADVRGGESGTVNILGYGIQDPGWSYGIAELRTLLEAMGLRMGAALNCRPTPEQVRDSGSAALNILVHPELCTGTAAFYEEEFGVPYLMPMDGAPVGYRATRSFLREVADATGTDPEPALALVDGDEARVRSVLTTYDRHVDLLRARRFAVRAESSTAYPLVQWMTDVFGMVPDSVRCPDGFYGCDLRAYLGSVGAAGAMDREPDGSCEVVFTDGLTAAEGRARRQIASYVEVCMPRGRVMDLMGRCVVGRPGCRYILDEMINGVSKFRCGQPTYGDMR